MERDISPPLSMAASEQQHHSRQHGLCAHFPPNTRPAIAKYVRRPPVRASARAVDRRARIQRSRSDPSTPMRRRRSSSRRVLLMWACRRRARHCPHSRSSSGSVVRSSMDWLGAARVAAVLLSRSWTCWRVVYEGNGRAGTGPVATFSASTDAIASWPSRPAGSGGGPSAVWLVVPGLGGLVRGVRDELEVMVWIFAGWLGKHRGGRGVEFDQPRSRRSCGLGFLRRARARRVLGPAPPRVR